LLASGSDDVQVIVWDPFRKKQLTTIRTGHNGNIFSVKVCQLTAFAVVVCATSTYFTSAYRSQVNQLSTVYFAAQIVLQNKQLTID